MQYDIVRICTYIISTRSSEFTMKWTIGIRIFYYLSSMVLSEFAVTWVWHCQHIRLLEQYGVVRIFSKVNNKALLEFAITWAVWYCQNLQLHEQYSIVRICNYLSTMPLLEFEVIWAVLHCQNLQFSNMTLSESTFMLALWDCPEATETRAIGGGDDDAGSFSLLHIVYACPAFCGICQPFLSSCL